MTRGFFGGVVWGTLVALFLAGVASLFTALPDRGMQPRTVSAVDEATDTQPSGAGADAKTDGADQQDSVDATAPAPAPQPETGDASAAMTPPAGGTDTDVVAIPETRETPEVAPAPVAVPRLSVESEPPVPELPTSAPAETAFPQSEIAAADVPPTAEGSLADATPLPDPVPAADAPASENAPEPAQAMTPAGSVANLAPGVATNRLPSIGETVVVTEEPSPETASVEETDIPALARYAAPFENPEGKAMMSIVLLDDGTSPIGLEALASFPYPLSFAVDASLGNAGDIMRRYRDAGFEVLAMVNLPEEATPTDIETAMLTYLRRVPEAVAVMEGDKTGVQANRAMSDQLTAILKASGHGLVLFPKGLNTGQKLAQKAGLPARSVFRDFDSKGQNANAIRRFLDNAALKADAGEKGVVMVGRLQANTISALLLWGLQDRAQRVALAPVSAVLLDE